MKKLFLLGLVAVMGLSASCVSKKKFTDLETEKNTLSTQLADAENKVEMLSSEKAELETTKSQLETKVNQIESDLQSTKNEVSSLKRSVSQKDETIQELEVIEKNVNEAFGSVEAVAESAGFSMQEKEDQLYLVLPELITFRSGSSRVHSDYSEVLDKVANMLKSNGSVHCIVEGHTDHRAILNANFKDNWDLSSQRSIEVAKKLIKLGVDVNQLTVAGKSDSMPVVEGENLSVKELAKNRRVEFVLIPNISEIMPD